MSFRVHGLMSRAGYASVARVILKTTPLETSALTVRQDRRPSNLTLAVAAKTEPAGHFEMEQVSYRFQLAITPAVDGKVDFLAILDGEQKRFSLPAGTPSLGQGLFKKTFQVPASWSPEMRPRTWASMERNHFSLFASRLNNNSLALYLYRFCGDQAPTDHAPSYAPLNLVPEIPARIRG
jgi:hypothetical protein